MTRNSVEYFALKDKLAKARVDWRVLSKERPTAIRATGTGQDIERDVNRRSVRDHRHDVARQHGTDGANGAFRLPLPNRQHTEVVQYLDRNASLAAKQFHVEKTRRSRTQRNERSLEAQGPTGRIAGTGKVREGGRRLVFEQLPKKRRGNATRSGGGCLQTLVRNHAAEQDGCCVVGSRGQLMLHATKTPEPA